MNNVIMSSIWPEWQIEERLGGGSYGEVFKAIRKDHLESYAAIKVISIPKNEFEIDTLRSEGMRLDETETYFQNVVNDFVKEIQLMETFKGTQNIVSVEDYKVVKKEGELGWDIYIRMELLTPLDRFFCNRIPNESEAIKIGIDICTALEMCAERRVIHRDIKPENIFVNSFGNFKLGDFGIARTLGNASTSMTQAGSPNYLAPEITKSSRYDATVDLYSLGLVLYRYTNDNRLPFIEAGQSTSPSERQRALMRRFEGEPLAPPCNASQNLAEVILTACAYNPARRYKSPTEMKNALISIANGTYESTYNYQLFEAERFSYNETRAVRPAEGVQKPYYAAPFDNTAGNVQSAVRPRREFNTSLKPEYIRKLRIRKIILISIAVIAVLVCAAIFVIPNLLKNKDKPNTGIEQTSSSSTSAAETIDYSDSDEQKIAEIIKEAEAFASSNDYDSAYEKIQAALVTYPKSASLMEKEQEYYNIRYRRDTLETAKTFAEMDSFPEAITVIKDAQAKQGDCPEYQTALEEYTVAYKSAVIKQADAAAANNDYLLAVETINDAVSVIGEDAELSAKATMLENSYVTDVIKEADALITKEDYIGASAVLDPALQAFPNNKALLEKQTLIENSASVALLEACPPYEVAGYDAPSKISVGGVSYNKGFTLQTNWSNDGYAIFNLGKKYQTLEFDIGHLDGTTMNRANVEIYLNGELFDNYEMHSTDMTKHNTIDVTGITQLYIKIRQSDTGSYTSYGIVNAVLAPDPAPPVEKPLPSDKYLITECPPYEVAKYDAPSKISVCGVSYNKGFTLQTNWSNDGYAIFNLGKKYQTLEFDIGHLDGTTMNRANVEIYLNGELFDNYEMHSTDMTKHNTIDVTGITQLYIKIWQSDTGSYTSYGIVNAVLIE